MATVLDLPTEILCAIFELVIDQWTDSIPQSSPAFSGTYLQLPSPSPSTLPPNATQDLCSLPPLKDLTQQCITLSHICTRLRAIAVDMQSLWSSIHLGRNAFSIEHTTPPNMNLTASFLSRSNSLPLYIDITIDVPYLTLGSRFHFHENSIQDVLQDHVPRCHALRLACSDLIIADVFDVFMEYNSGFNVLNPEQHHPSPLTRIHVVQTSTALYKRSFPSDLSRIAPNLESLRAVCAPIVAYPRWRLRDVVLEDTYISYQNHSQLFIKSPSNRIIFHRLSVPGGRPYVRRLSDARYSPATCVVFSELRCHGPRDEQREIYELFFTLSLFDTLQELELSFLDNIAMSGLVSVLRPTPPLVFPDLRKLTLRGISLNSRSLVLALVTSFPSLSQMVLEEVTPYGSLVLDVWRNGMDHGIWPQLREVVMDGTVLSRRVSPV